MAAQEALRRDQYCIASVQFWDAPIAPYVVRCIFEVYVAAEPLDQIRVTNVTMVMAGWRQIPWF